MVKSFSIGPPRSQTLRFGKVKARPKPHNSTKGRERPQNSAKGPTTAPKSTSGQKGAARPNNSTRPKSDQKGADRLTTTLKRPGAIIRSSDGVRDHFVAVRPTRPTTAGKERRGKRAPRTPLSGYVSSSEDSNKEVPRRRRTRVLLFAMFANYNKQSVLGTRIGNWQEELILKEVTG